MLIFSVFTLVNLLPQEAFANTSASHPFILEWGESGLMKAGYFSFPQNLASDDFGNIYVTDLGNMRVQKFDNDGTFLNAWGSSGSGSGQFRSPMGIEVFEGSVFVVDSQLNRIQKFDLDGNFVTKWGEQGSGASQFLLPNGIAAGNNGTIYVVDTGNQRIQKFTQDGEYISEFGASGMEDGKFLSPKGIAIDKEENIYVTDPGKNKIFKFNSDGLYLNSFGPNAGGISIKPEGLVIDPVGNIYATDTNYNRILQISQEGATLTIWGSMGIMNGQFKTPKDIEVDAFGQVFVVDSNGHRIQKFGSPYVTEIPEEEPSTSESQTTQETQSLPKVEPVPGDLTKPVITTPNDLFIEATGGLTPVSVGQAMATDESGIQSLTNNAPAKFPLGVTTIIWTAIDGAGNMAIATQTISVVDTIPPLITPIPDVTVEAQTPGENPVTLTIPETLDVVGVISVTNDAPTVFPLGETIITWTAIDVAGNLATTTQKVNVVDTTKPTIYAPGDVVIEATSLDKNEVILGETIVIDNGEIISVSNDAPQFYGLGNTTVTWIAADAGGNTATREQLVTVIDTTNPELITPPDVVFEAVSDTENIIDLGIVNVTDVQEVSVTNDAPSAFPIGITIVVWSALDPDGNFATASQQVTVLDTTPPTLNVPQDITIEATSVENNVVTLGNLTAQDVSGISSISHNAPETFPLGTTIITWNATDNYGNSVSSQQTVTVIDTTPPKITAPEDIILEAISTDENFADLKQPQITDIIAVESVSNDAPELFPIGMTTVTWTATDTSGNSASDTQIVTVSDTTSPTITPPTDIVVEATSPDGVSVDIGPTTATDIIGVDTISNNAPSLYYLGNTTIIWIATDIHGNTASDNQTITVVDTTAPSIVPPPDVVSEAQNPISNVVAIGVASADDIVGIISIDNDSPIVFSLGDTLVTWTATDAAGNIATATQKVTITDTTPPTIIAPESIQVEATSATETIVTLGNATGTDLIGLDLITNDAPSAFAVGETIVIWTATDLGGLTSTDTQTITVADTTPPTIHVPAIITVEATSKDQNVVEYGSINADDLVGVTSVSNDAPEVFPFGLTTITWTASDEAGNIATATQQVSVIDTISPTIIIPEDIEMEAVNANANTVNLGIARASDNVDINSITNDAPMVFPLGQTTITWIASDISGNTVNATQNITLIDTTAPTITEPEAIIVEATSETENAISLNPPESTDSVSIAVTITNDAPQVFPLGESIVTWTATDDAGNLASTTQTITVLDTTPPELTIPADVIIDATGLETLVVIGDAISSDLTDSAPTIANDGPFSYPLGETIVTWTTSDQLGNTISTTQIINVQACGKPDSYYNTIMGTPDEDILFGTNLADLIFGFEGDDIISGAKGNDCIFGGDGDDIVFGNEGNDNISGGDGSDILKGQSGDDIVSGGNGIDIIDGGDDRDSCNASEESAGDLTIKCE